MEFSRDCGDMRGAQELEVTVLVDFAGDEAFGCEMQGFVCGDVAEGVTAVWGEQRQAPVLLGRGEMCVYGGRRYVHCAL